MTSINKNVAIALVVIAILIASFSFYKYFISSSGDGEGARAQITSQLQNNAPGAGPPPSQMPSSAGLHMPGNKH